MPSKHQTGEKGMLQPKSLALHFSEAPLWWQRERSWTRMESFPITYFAIEDVSNAQTANTNRQGFGQWAMLWRKTGDWCALTKRWERLGQVVVGALHDLEGLRWSPLGGEIGEDLMKPAKEEPRAGRTDGGKGEREKKELMCSEERGTKQFAFGNLDHILVPYNITEGLWRIRWYDVRGCKKLPLEDVWALGPGSGWKPVCGPE